MKNTQVNILNNLQGWLQQCRRCGNTKQYDQYSKNCERCNEGNLDVFFNCPDCGAITEYGKMRCSGCKKKISELFSSPLIESKILTTGKNKRYEPQGKPLTLIPPHGAGNLTKGIKRILITLAGIFIFGVLVFVACSKIL